jgi:hypothetical protein
MTSKRFRKLQDRLADPLLTALAIMLALLLFVFGPMQAAGITWAHFFGIAFAFVVLATVFIVSGSVIAVGGIFVSIVLVVTATVLRLGQPSALDIYLEATSWLITGVTLAIVTARAVFAPGQITFHRVIGAVLLYLTIGLIFVAFYAYVSLLEPNAFTGLPPLKDDLSVAGNLIYFSFVTLTSVGYGDIVPLHPYARGLANVEAIFGQLYPATLLARLVTLELESRHGR